MLWYDTILQISLSLLLQFKMLKLTSADKTNSAVNWSALLKFHVLGKKSKNKI